MNYARFCFWITFRILLVTTLMFSQRAIADDASICRADFVFSVKDGSDVPGIRKYIMQSKIAKRFGCNAAKYSDTLFSKNKIFSLSSDQKDISFICTIANAALFDEMNNIFRELTEGSSIDKTPNDDELTVLSPVTLSTTTASCKTKCYSVQCSTDGTYYCVNAPRADACKVASRCQ